MPRGHIKGRVLSKMLLLWVSKEGQSSKKCSSLSTSSFDGHIAMTFFLSSKTVELKIALSRFD